MIIHRFKMNLYVSFELHPEASIECYSRMQQSQLHCVSGKLLRVGSKSSHDKYTYRLNSAFHSLKTAVLKLLIHMVPSGVYGFVNNLCHLFTVAAPAVSTTCLSSKQDYTSTSTLKQIEALAIPQINKQHCKIQRSFF